MNNMYLNLLVKLQALLTREEGQDMIEYVLLAALIALAAAAGAKTVATALTTQFTAISTAVA